MRPFRATTAEIAALAGCQHGVVTRSQLLALGMSDRAITRGAAGGRLHRLHRGVFAVGHRVLTIEGRWMAATLATGGVLSHATAAAAWDLRPRTDAIHVTVAGDAGRRRRAGLRVHRSRTIEATTHRGIPITTPARTIIDLARTLKGRPLEAALDRAEHLRLVDFSELKHRPIPRSLQAVLSLYTASNPTRSELEERFIQLCDDHGIPRPDINARIEGYEVDFVWRDKRLIVEVDGYAYHRSPTAFEADRERDIDLARAGWLVRRFTWTQITRRPAWVARALDM
jgi:restriction endonuclease-like protein/putative AbiEi antitoxin of type IV toxin-antitoxin system